MFLYCVSIQIDSGIHDDWLSWMQQVHIPEVLRTGCFTGCVLARVREPKSDSQRIAYAIRYSCNSFEAYQHYRQEHAPALQRQHTSRYPGKFKATREVLETVWES